MEERRKIHWVSLKVVNLPLEKGGLGVKNILVFSLALLNKWRWRTLQGQDSLWYNILKTRYDDLSTRVFCGGVINKVSPSFSTWWKDILKIGSSSFYDPIVGCSMFVTHNGFNTLFLGS